jgi:hypothetical protein
MAFILLVYCHGPQRRKLQVFVHGFQILLGSLFHLNLVVTIIMILKIFIKKFRFRHYNIHPYLI